jgi:hypothetical protein
MCKSAAAQIHLRLANARRYRSRVRHHAEGNGVKETGSQGNGVRSFIITRILRCFAFNRPERATRTVFCRKSATLRLLHSPIAHARAYGTTHLFSHCQHRKSHGFGSFGIASSIGGSPPDTTDGTRKVTAPLRSRVRRFNLRRLRRQAVAWFETCCSGAS